MPETDDEQFLRDLNYAEDAWVLSGQQWYTAVEVAEHLGISDGGVRNLAERGEIPGAVLHDTKRIGWRLPRSGLISYLADQRRKTAQRQRNITA